ncbi:hypothetical protein H5T87_10860 [bacterium]|nr:hypothetical protein [bacterium]
MQRKIFYSLFLVLHSWLMCSASITVIDVKDRDWDEGLLLVTLQGIVNKDGPHIYLLFNPQGDDFWLGYYKKRFDLKYEFENKLSNIINKYKKYLKGYIVWEPRVPDTANVATLIAGLENVVAVSPRLEDIVKVVGLTKVMDLRGKFSGLKKWQIYKWMFDRYWKRSNPRVVACLDTATISFEEIDLADFHNKEVFIRFEAKNKNPVGCALRCLYLIDEQGKVIKEIKPGSREEEEFIYEKGNSWLYTTGDWPYNGVRVANGEQYWIYKLPPTYKRVSRLKLTLLNYFTVKISDSPDGPYKKIAESSQDWKYIGSPYNQIRDLVVMYKGFPFDLSANPSDKEEYKVRDEILSHMKPLGWVLGWHTPRDDEFLHTRHSSQKGQIVICSSSAPNFSFHKWLKPISPPKTQYTPIPLYEKDKIYVSFILSDGDALNRMNNLQGGQWLSKERGKVPFGWEVQPLLLDLAPGMLSYYFETATPMDCMVAPSGGIGYIYPQYFPYLAKYLQQTGNYLRHTGFNVITLNAVYPISSSQIPSLYAQHLNKCVLGVVEGYTYVGGPDFLYPNFIWLKTRLPKGFWDNLCSPQVIEESLKRIASATNVRPLFIPIHLTCYYITIDDIARLVSKLDHNIFKVVRPDYLFHLVYAKSRDEKIVCDLPSSKISPTLSFDLIPVKSISIPITLINLFNKSLRVQFVIEKNEEFGVEGGFYSLELEPGRRFTKELYLTPRILVETTKKVNVINVKVITEGQSKGMELKFFVNGELEGTINHQQFRLMRVWEEEEFFHGKGKWQVDEEALNGASWVAEEGEGEGNIIHGPYEELEEGKYLALFRIKLQGDATFKIDVCYHSKDVQGLEGILAQREVTQALQDKYLEFTLPFEVKRKLEGERVEYRVFWNGKGKIYLDRVQLYQQL